MMKRMGNSVGIPGMGGAMGMGAPSANSRKGKKLKAAQKKKNKSKSGNPMKRAQEEQALRDRLAGKKPAAPQGASFMKQQEIPDIPQLPDGFGGLGSLLGGN